MEHPVQMWSHVFGARATSPVNTVETGGRSIKTACKEAGIEA